LDGQLRTRETALTIVKVVAGGFIEMGQN
jgi:hypothetical protein